MKLLSKHIRNPPGARAVGRAIGWEADHAVGRALPRTMAPIRLYLGTHQGSRGKPGEQFFLVSVTVALDLLLYTLEGDLREWPRLAALSVRVDERYTEIAHYTWRQGWAHDFQFHDDFIVPRPPRWKFWRRR